MEDLLPLQRMPIRVATTIGTLSLFPQRFKDIGPFSTLPATELPANRLRLYLPRIAARAGTTSIDEEAPRLDEASCRALGDDDLERIAEAYLAAPEVQQLAEGMTPRTDAGADVSAEPATAYLDRLLKANHERQLDDVPATYASLDKRFGPPLTTALAALNRNASSLRETAANFMQAPSLGEKSGHSVPTIRGIDAAPSGEKDPLLEWRPILDAIVAENARYQQERDEGVLLSRSVGKLTAESALLLASLGESTTELLRQFTDTARQSEEAARKSLRITLALVALATLLAGTAAAVSLMGYLQSRESMRTADQFQESLQRTMKATSLAQEDQVKALDGRMRELGEGQAAMASSLARAAADAAPPRSTEAVAPPHRETAKPAAAPRGGKRKSTR